DRSIKRFATPVMYTLGQAARAVSKAKSTISRDVKSGKISAARNADGSVSIDPAELHRVYPAIPATGSGNGKSNDLQPAENVSATVRERENALLRERLADKDNVIADLRRRLDVADEDRRRLTMILADQRPRKRWWRRIVGGARGGAAGTDNR